MCATPTHAPSASAPSLSAPSVIDGLPCLVVGTRHAGWLTDFGEILRETPGQAAARLRVMPPPIIVHAPSLWRRLGCQPMAALDLLELFAFACPGQTAAPTPRGLALALDLPPPTPGPENEAAFLPRLAASLLARLPRNDPELAGLVAYMGEAGWPWAPPLLAAMQAAGAAPNPALLGIWRRLPAWEETAPLPPPGSQSVAPHEARARLAALLHQSAEARPGQSDYSAAVAQAFAPAESPGAPQLVLAEAGTGTGKTLGYLAPASLWAERNHGPVWVATYTRHLQRQIDQELARLYPDPAERARRAVIRKGRENYLCLLNYADAVAAAPLNPAARVLLGIVARFALTSRDGDLSGGDLPGFVADLFGQANLANLADRRGECIHGACPHYRVCFVEHTIRRARRADIVVANHALVMAQSVWGGLDDTSVPTRYVFDEGHHLFEAADSAFAVSLSGQECALLRRWLIGAEGGRSRDKGLRRRMEDLLPQRPALEAPLAALLTAARDLPADGWTTRLADATPRGAAESFLLAAHTQRQARTSQTGPTRTEPDDQEADLYPVSAPLIEAAQTLARALRRIATPLETLLDRLDDWLETESETLTATERLRIEALQRGLRRRALGTLTAWHDMLEAVGEPPPEPGSLRRFVTLLFQDRRAGRLVDTGLRRHWLDPTLPFATTLASNAQGLLITSATLRDSGPDAEAAWDAAEARLGVPHLASVPMRVGVLSPFDYAAQTRAVIVTDVTQEIPALAQAFRVLFSAARGGGLGLFTAISRLRAVHARIAPALEAEGIPLLAQHVDAMDNASLVEVFRAEADSCLLGTDAMRDGVDVPGRALRLVVFERVPWPRPDILHRERRIHLSGGDPTAYDDRIARRRLRQAFGRLIRNSTDHGVFILLDRRTPSRLLSAFPDGVAAQRLGLAEAARLTAGFLGEGKT